MYSHMALGGATKAQRTNLPVVYDPAQNQAGATSTPKLTQPATPGQAGVRAHLDKFFDTNNDRRITVGESFDGLRRLGLGRMAAAGAALAINVGLARNTGGSLFTVELDGIHKAKHKGDSGIIDQNGHFVQAKFDEMFANYSKTVPDAMTEAELVQFRQDNIARDDSGAFEKVAALGEFGLLFRFGAQEIDGQKVLTRDRMLEFYHGDLFHTLADEHAAKREARSDTFTGKLQNFFNSWIF